jgi:MFS family permease
MLSNASLQLLFGRIYKFYPAKYVFLASIGLFEVGSAICGAAPNSTAFIIGRAVAGAGSSGVMSGVMQIMVYLVPLSKRPVYTSMFGAVFGISSAVGPLLGGVLTQRLSWRWCFFINLFCAPISIGAVVFLVKARKPLEAGASFKEQINQLDPIGTLIFIPGITCLILALQWGGVKYPWSNGRVVALLVVFSIAFIAWLVVQSWKKESATVPPRIFFQRSIAAGFFFALMITGSMLILVYYIAIWFQAIKGDSPLMSGISSLPSVLALVVSAIMSGFSTQKIGYYVPTMVIGPSIASIGAGLLTTLKPDTGHPEWIGFQFIYGFGLGMCMQQASLAAQTVLPAHDVSTGIAVMFFAQQLGGAVFLSVAQNVFTQQLIKGLSRVSGLNTDRIINSGATDLRNMIPAPLLPQVLSAYNTALIHTWYASTALSCAIVIPALCMEWKSIKSNGKGKGPGLVSPTSNSYEIQRSASPTGKRPATSRPTFPNAEQQTTENKIV